MWRVTGSARRAKTAPMARDSGVRLRVMKPGLPQSRLGRMLLRVLFPPMQRRLRLLPKVPALLVERPERIFVIGWGTGVTAGEVAALGSVREVYVAEIAQGAIDFQLGRGLLEVRDERLVDFLDRVLVFGRMVETPRNALGSPGVDAHRGALLVEGLPIEKRRRNRLRPGDRVKGGATVLGIVRPGDDG